MQAVRHVVTLARPKPLASRLTDEERARHDELVDRLGANSIWKDRA
jgi:hypothetical protein